jgi:uncharacterized damage-inducible protein DinB
MAMSREAELIEAAIATLEQGERLLLDLDQEAYVRTVPVAFNASIGGHYRHCLDHFRSVLEAAGAEELNYDLRERGTPIETDRAAALEATRSLRAGYERLEVGLLPRPLAVTCKTSYTAADSQTTGSTVGREIMYAVAHAVHHYALIGVMAALFGLRLPAGFGVAPSTLKHQAETEAACVR